MAFFLGLALLGAFFAWESHTDHPMLDVKFFKNPRFTAASTGIMLIFFAMFGITFLITQYFQFVLGYSPFATGIRFLPWAAVMMIGSPLSSKIVDRFGTKVVVTTGLDARDGGSGVALDAHRRQQLLARRDPAHDADGQRHGAHDGARDRVDHELVAARQGRCRLRGERHHPPGRWRDGRRHRRQRAVVDLRVEDGRLPRRHVDQGHHRDGIKESLGAALGVAGKLSKTAPDLAASLTRAANSAYVDGMQIGILVAAGATLLGAIIAFLWLPARARREDVEMQDAAHAEPERGATAAPAPPVTGARPAPVEA